MKKLITISSIALVLFTSSCTMHNKMIQGAPLEARVNFQSSDLEYVGEVTGTATQYYVLGIPYGGRRNHTASTYGGVIPNVPDRAYNNALYDALSQKADADFVLPLSSESTVDHSFLGKIVELKLRAKEFKIKTK